MRRFAFFILVALLGLFPSGILGKAVSAQGVPPGDIEQCAPGSAPDAPWEGVCEPFPVEVQQAPMLPDGQVLQPYVTVFKQQDAATVEINPDIEEYSAEFMVVYVKQGEFALDLNPETTGVVLVSSWVESIQTLEYNPNADPKSEHDEFTDDGAPFYTPNGVLPNDCTIACPVSPGQAVRLGPGDMAVAEAGTICLYCLLNSGDPTMDDEQGVLLAFVLPDPEDPTFSWIKSWMTFQTGTESLDPTTTLAWNMFSPGTRCKGH